MPGCRGCISRTNSQGLASQTDRSVFFILGEVIFSGNGKPPRDLFPLRSTESLVAISYRIRVRSPFGGFLPGQVAEVGKRRIPVDLFFGGVSAFLFRGKSDKIFFGIPEIRS